MSENPYQAPLDLSASAIVAAPVSDAEEIRRAHIKHEASIKSIGLLYYLSGFFVIVVVAASFGSQRPGLPTLLSVGLLILGLIQLVAAYHLRKFRPWARIAAIIISAVGLLGFPLGTLINAYFLYLLASKKGVYIFSPEYQEIIADTPHVRYKTSKLVWIIVIVLILAIAAIVIGLSTSH
jgi:drug/metabolite transporter (DMT)-like permease